MIGQTVSHYRILSKLGAGGMGVVYQAEDTRLKRPVALKFLPADLTRDESAKARFIHEARAASALQHHNICTIHEIDETPDGQLFIAMDCYPGETLKERIARGPVPAEQAADITRQVAAGLAKAHAAGMVHRDIKPANLLVTEDGVVKILDFGLAKLSGATKMTKTGMTVGTVSYMSPEQARGDDVDARSDIWSLGAVLYEMLTGRVPFPGEHEAAVLYGIMHAEPRPLGPSGKDGKLQHVVDRALQKEPGNRYQGTGELLRDLEGEGLPPGRARRRPGRGRMVAVAGTLAVAAVLGATVLPRLWKPKPVTPAPALAVVGFRDLTTPADPTTTESMTELVNIGLVQADVVRIVSSDYLHDLRRRLFGSSRGDVGEGRTIELARQAKATLFLTGTIRQSGSGTMITWRLVDVRSGDDVTAGRMEGSELAALADRMIAEALPVIARTCGTTVTSAPPAVETITTGSPRAHQHYVAGVLAGAEGRPDDAIVEFKRAVAMDSTFALAYLHLGSAYYGSFGYQDGNRARECIDKAWRERARLGIRDRMRLESKRLELTGDSKDLRDATAILREMRQRWPDDRPTLIDLGGMLHEHWHFAEARAVMEEGRALFPDDPVIGVMYERALGFMGRNEEARRAGLANVQKNPGDPFAWDALGDVYLSLGRPDSAETAFRNAAKIDPGRAPENFARCAYWLGDLAGAIRILEQALAQENLSANRREALTMISSQGLNLAALYVEAGRYERAREVSRPYMSQSFGRASQLLLMMGNAREVVDRIGAAEGNIKKSNAHSWLRHRGLALAMLGDTRGAREAVIADGDSQWDGIFRVYGLLVQVEAALADRQPGAALDSLNVMKRIMPALFVAPGATFLDIRVQDARSRVHQMQGHPDKAARVYEEWLRRCGGHALSHYELGRIYEEMKRPAQAKREYATFLDMWSAADEGLPQLVDARKRLAGVQESAPP